jgi:signal transduction histidine kinase/DNA-binding response OmpR family regulator
MLRFIRKRLGRTILTVLAISVALVMASEIYFRISVGVKDRIEMMTEFGKELAASTYAGIKYPMSVGDSDAIKRQLLDIKEKMRDSSVFICDFNQEIIYATHEEKLHTPAGDSLVNKEAVKALARTLETGIDPRTAFEETVEGRRYLVTLHPILNQPDCYHCHGASRKVLGGMVIKMNTDLIYAEIASGRNRSIMITLLGIGAIIALTYAMLRRWVGRPIEELAEKAGRFAEGDMSVSVKITSEDEIGILGDTFNHMVSRISAFSRELEAEVERRTMMLREKTLLLERANRELRELDKLKSSFLANMSHELRTPMNSIIGYTELIIDGVDGPVNEEQANSLTKVVNNARHLLQLINDILDMSKIEAGKIELDIKEINLKGLVDSVAATIEPSIIKKGLTLSLRFDKALPMVYADEEKVRQILINLLSNAVKFTFEGGITLTAAPSVRGVRPGEAPLFVEICIEDTGIGIKEEEIIRLFDKFSQLDISTTRQYEGTGLGLSIARGLVVLHKGVIWATSEYGKGSKFCFTLPAKKEIMEKPAEPVLEPAMAEGLSDYFDKPADTFLKEPRYAGKPIKCWEYIHCGQTSCPAYGCNEHRCWLILGTHCKGTKVAAYPEKVDFCKGCEVIERLIMESDESRDSAAPENGLSAGDAAQKKTVLVIDDNLEAIEIIRKYLEKDYHVVSLVSGKKAVDTARELKPVAITLDIMMPTKDGWQVLQELKSTSETQDIPVIILSIVEEKKLGFSLGAAEYIVKPIEKTVLLRKLKNLEKVSEIKKVLVVDDDPDAVALISAVFSEAGYEVKQAYTSNEAISSIKESMPDLIVLNLTMPEASGIDVIEYIRTTEEEARDIPLIVVTNKKTMTSEEIAKLNGRIKAIIDKESLAHEDFITELRDTVKKYTAGKNNG